MAKQTAPYRMTALSDIKPYERNPRIISQAAVDAVARSIQAYGFRQPIVVDKSGVILAGHTRYRAAQQLGMTEVPVVWQTDITDIQARGYRIADNKVAELSAWDRDALAAEVRDLASICDDDLDALGLADWELDRILHEPTQELRPAELDALVERATTSWTPRVPGEAPKADGQGKPAEASALPESGAAGACTDDRTLEIRYSAASADFLADFLGVGRAWLARNDSITADELRGRQPTLTASGGNDD